MPRLQVKHFHEPDVVRRVPRARFETVQMGEAVIAHAVSSTIMDLLEGSALSLADAGSHELKGLAGNRQLFRLVDLAGAPPTPR